ncbi:hypothetical protein IVA87_08010 [Bradyrhizobium sp. 147]|uniref:hypothetical protein n=1 Tax=Bradyrhizobium sp. 147 TaxID=2782623 RepID=UPI001FF9B178|nr:hypothetical protein [Bradyrhizobium sp. 147]MCK1679404.1 hypothetical protein [Bradyrhizobium sp. 147]
MTTQAEFDAMVEQARTDALNYRPLKLAAVLAFTSVQIVGDDQFARLALAGILTGLAKELRDSVPNVVELRTQ